MNCFDCVIIIFFIMLVHVLSILFLNMLWKLDLNTRMSENIFIAVVNYDKGDAKVCSFNSANEDTTSLFEIKYKKYFFSVSKTLFFLYVISWRLCLSELLYEATNNYKTYFFYLLWNPFKINYAPPFLAIGILHTNNAWNVVRAHLIFFSWFRLWKSWSSQRGAVINFIT